ncbi:MAG: RNA-processing protein [Candidatus Aenigmarchaeota archaeon]|nr:RNA-processing protein [Candidatus Aenigmarchaeota archaeon]
MLKEVMIPERRKHALIGRGGSVKREIEEKTATRINISDSIEINGEPLDALAAASVVTAIGRGFSHDVALELLDDENTLYVIEFPGNSERIKARIIGTRGKAKRRMEIDTGTHISIYGKTVSILGKHDAVHVAKRVIERLMQGAPHRNAYKLMK